MERVWKGVVVSPATVAKRVELLRQALGDDSAEPRYIALVRGYGYRLIPAVSTEDAHPEPSRGAPPRARKGRTASWTMMTLAVMAVVVTTVVRWPATDPPERSIAVPSPEAAERVARAHDEAMAFR